MTYPTEITQEILDTNAHITDAEIRQDIADTEREITTMHGEIEGYEIIADSNPSSHQGKMAALTVGAKKAGVAQRQAFVAFLERLLDARGENQ